jgi:hypothetical protein
LNQWPVQGQPLGLLRALFCSIGRLISTGMLNAARPGLTFRTADTRGALPRRCWPRFFVVLLPVPDLLLFAKHLL